MGVQPEGKRSDPYERFRGEAQRFFYAQLERIGLGEAQIESQDITELETAWRASTMHCGRRNLSEYSS